MRIVICYYNIYIRRRCRAPAPDVDARLLLFQDFFQRFTSSSQLIIAIIHFFLRAPRLSLGSAVDAEAVAGLQHVRVTTRCEDLLIVTAPLGLVDGINVVLDLHDDAAVLSDSSREVGVVEETLVLLDSKSAILAIARVDLEGILVRVDVELDARPR